MEDKELIEIYLKGFEQELDGNHYNNITHYKQINKPEQPLY